MGLVNPEEIQIPLMALMLFIKTKYSIVLAFCMLKLAEGDVSELNIGAVKCTHTHTLIKYNCTIIRKKARFTCHTRLSLREGWNWDLWETGFGCYNPCIISVSLKRALNCPTTWTKLPVYLTGQVTNDISTVTHTLTCRQFSPLLA